MPCFFSSKMTPQKGPISIRVPSRCHNTPSPLETSKDKRVPKKVDFFDQIQGVSQRHNILNKFLPPLCLRPNACPPHKALGGGASTVRG
jgi:hypothetical protein